MNTNLKTIKEEIQIAWHQGDDTPENVENKIKDFEAELLLIQKEWKKLFGSDAIIPIKEILGDKVD